MFPTKKPLAVLSLSLLGSVLLPAASEAQDADSYVLAARQLFHLAAPPLQTTAQHGAATGVWLDPGTAMGAMDGHILDQSGLRLMTLQAQLSVSALTSTGESRSGGILGLVTDTQGDQMAMLGTWVRTIKGHGLFDAVVYQMGIFAGIVPIIPVGALSGVFALDSANLPDADVMEMAVLVPDADQYLPKPPTWNRKQILNSLHRLFDARAEAEAAAIPDADMIRFALSLPDRDQYLPILPMSLRKRILNALDRIFGTALEQGSSHLTAADVLRLAVLIPDLDKYLPFLSAADRNRILGALPRLFDPRVDAEAAQLPDADIFRLAFLVPDRDQYLPILPMSLRQRILNAVDRLLGTAVSLGANGAILCPAARPKTNTGPDADVMPFSLSSDQLANSTQPPPVIQEVGSFDARWVLYQ